MKIQLAIESTNSKQKKQTYKNYFKDYLLGREYKKKSMKKENIRKKNMRKANIRKNNMKKEN